MTVNTLAFQAPVLNIALPRGDDRRVKLTFATELDANNVPVDTIDVSGWEISAQVRSYPNAPDVLMDVDVDATDATSGIVWLNLPAAETAELPARELVWDCQRTQPDVLTLFAGSFTIGADVTRVTVS